MWNLRLREVEEAMSSQSLRKGEPRSLTEVHLVPKYISFCDTGPLPQPGDQKWPLSWFLVLMGSVPQGSALQWPGLQASKALVRRGTEWPMLEDVMEPLVGKRGRMPGWPWYSLMPINLTVNCKPLDLLGTWFIF